MSRPEQPRSAIATAEIRQGFESPSRPASQAPSRGLMGAWSPRPASGCPGLVDLSALQPTLPCFGVLVCKPRQQASRWGRSGDSSRLLILSVVGPSPAACSGLQGGLGVGCMVRPCLVPSPVSVSENAVHAVVFRRGTRGWEPDQGLWPPCRGTQGCRPEPRRQPPPLRSGTPRLRRWGLSISTSLSLANITGPPGKVGFSLDSSGAALPCESHTVSVFLCHSVSPLLFSPPSLLPASLPPSSLPHLPPSCPPLSSPPPPGRLPGTAVKN